MQTGTLTPYPTATPLCAERVCLSELLPAPYAVDWDGDGEANYKDEWIELYNPCGEDVDLRGYILDDRADGGAAPYVIPPGSIIGAGNFRVFYLRETGVTLNNAGDTVRLLVPGGEVIDEVTYPSMGRDVAYARIGGCQGVWVKHLSPSPGLANPEPTPSPTRTLPLTRTPTTTPASTVKWLYLPLIIQGE